MFFSSLSLILITALTVTLLQNVRVRFFLSDEAVIDFDFLLVRLIIYPTRRRKRKKRKIRDFGKNLIKNIKRASRFKRALDYLLEKSRLTIHRLNIPLKAENPARYALAAQNISSLINITLTYLYLKLDTLRTEDDIFFSETAPSRDVVRFDATLDTSLSVIIISFFRYLVNLSGVRKIVRNENE